MTKDTPEMLPDNSQDIDERCVGFGVPSGPLDRDLPIGMEGLGQQCDHRVQAEQARGGARDRAIRPLPLGFNAEMGSAFLKGGFDGPAFNECLHDFTWPIAGAGREVCPGVKLAAGVAHEHPPHRQHRLADPIPHRRPAGHVQATPLAVIPWYAHALPARLWLPEHLPQLRQPLALDARTAVGPGRTWRCGCVQGSIHAPRGNQAYAPTPTDRSQVLNTISLVADNGELDRREPAADQLQHLACPVWHCFVPQAQPMTDLGGGGRDAQYGKRP
jgi:hypothetical protein